LLVWIRDLEARLTPALPWNRASSAPGRIRAFAERCFREPPFPGREIYRDDDT
jgi:hypothetical protein